MTLIEFEDAPRGGRRDEVENQAIFFRGVRRHREILLLRGIERDIREGRVARRRRSCHLRTKCISLQVSHRPGRRDFKGSRGKGREGRAED